MSKDREVDDWKQDHSPKLPKELVGKVSFFDHGVAGQIKHWNLKGRFQIPLKIIAWYLGVHEDTVRRSLRRLEKMDIVEIGEYEDGYAREYRYNFRLENKHPAHQARFRALRHSRSNTDRDGRK